MSTTRSNPSTRTAPFAVLCVGVGCGYVSAVVCHAMPSNGREDVQEDGGCGNGGDLSIPLYREGILYSDLRGGWARKNNAKREKSDHFVDTSQI